VHDAAGGRTLRAESGGDVSPRGVSGGSDARADADERWMARALEEARAAASAGEVPVGAVIVREGEELVATQNRMIRDRDATSHAELLALRAASQLLGDQRLAGCTLYVTLEPCSMCAGAIVLARPDRVVFGAWDDKAGFGGSVGDLLRHPRLNHRPQVLAGVKASESSEMLKEFFRKRRACLDR
jgi:tRNA(adenine34) deaminase